MILAVLLSLTSWLYPWNIETGGNRVWGDWTNGRVFEARGGYVSLDRMRHDALAFGAEWLTLDEDYFRQSTFSARGTAWLTDAFRPELGAGLIGQDREGWFIVPGLQGWAGGWNLAARWSFLNMAAEYPGADDSRYRSDALDLSVGRMAGPFAVSAAVLRSSADGAVHWAPRVGLTGSLTRRFIVSASHTFGARRMVADPLTLNVDLNRDTQQAAYYLRVDYRLTPNYQLSAAYARTDYEPWPDPADDWPYRAQYLILAGRVRF